METHRARREEIWNAKVAEAVRVRVFKHAAEKFEKNFNVSDVGTDFLPQLIARFWQMTASGDSNNLNTVVKRLAGEWGGEPSNPNGIYIADSRTAIEQLRKLDRGINFRVLFLLIHGHKGTIGHANNYRSQREVKELAAEFEIDYVLIDAEGRLESCSTKHKQVHETYLNAVREKREETEIPKLFSQEWKERD